MIEVQKVMHQLAGSEPSAISTHFMDHYGVAAQQHLKGALWLFDYDQLAAHKHRATQVVQESRGLVLCAKTLAVVRMPFSRFFNIAETPSYDEDIDYANLEALEKVDGSLITIYFNSVTGHWQVGTRGMPFADARHRMGGVFHERVTAASGLKAKAGTVSFDVEIQQVLEKDITYLFEFIGPDNPHITPHEKSELVLLGARRHTGLEFNALEMTQLFRTVTAAGWNVRLPVSYPIEVSLQGLSRSSQVEAIKTWVATSSLFKGLHEGLVCRDRITGKRLKIKTPMYCATHLQGDSASVNLSLNRIVQLVVTGDATEFCLYVPHLAPIVKKAEAQLNEFLSSLEPYWLKVKDIENQKEFAVAVQNLVPRAGTGIFFQARKSNITPEQAWFAMPLDKKASLAEQLVEV